MGRTQELSTRNDDPERASCPFDRAHDGLVLSEGSCVFVLEAAEQPLRRGVPPYAEVRGAASSCDASGLYGIDPTAEPAARAIHRALQRSDVGIGDIDYVCAHANSSPAFDRKETLVIKKAFGEWAARLPVSSIKGVIGHPFGAAGAFQVTAAALAIRHQLIPPTYNLEVPDAECDLDYVPRQARPALVRNVLVTSYGYGGVNAYVVVAEPRL
jgi:3-oxoacyl-(acyl-carrier-protein) synthase